MAEELLSAKLDLDIGQILLVVEAARISVRMIPPPGSGNIKPQIAGFKVLLSRHIDRVNRRRREQVYLFKFSLVKVDEVVRVVSGIVSFVVLPRSRQTEHCTR